MRLLRDSSFGLCGERGLGDLLIGGGVGGGIAAGSGQHVESEVAARLDPFVVLFSEDGADEADQGHTVGEDADDAGAAADLFVESLLYPALGVGQPCAPCLV